MGIQIQGPAQQSNGPALLIELEVSQAQVCQSRNTLGLLFYCSSERVFGLCEVLFLVAFHSGAIGSLVRRK